MFSLSSVVTNGLFSQSVLNRGAGATPIAPFFTVVVLPVGLLGLATTELNFELGGWLLSGIGVLTHQLISFMSAANALAVRAISAVYFHSGIIHRW